MPNDAADPLRASQLRAVATRFLRVRPLVAGAGALVNAVLLSASGSPWWQLAQVGACFATSIIAFSAEAWLLRSRLVTERWLFASLLATAVVLGIGAAFTGGIESPFLPILLVPIVIALAAFGRRRSTLAISIGAAVVVVTLAVLPCGPVIAAPYRGLMLACSTTMALMLLWLGLTGLVDAYTATARSLDQMRVAAIDEAAERARSGEAWGAKVAHEIRNPLTSIKSLVQLVAGKNEDARNAKRFEVVLAEVQRVEGILNDYLRLARPLRDLVLARVRLDRIACDVAELFEARAASAGVTIALELEPVEALADATRIREALLNLTKNAIEALARVQGGRLILRVSRTNKRAEFCVVDDGPGIDPALFDHLGEPFVTSTEDGTGLGLMLARSVARQHGGELQLSSNGGTTATLWIPVRA